MRPALKLTAACGALLLGACATPGTPADTGPPSLLQLAAAGDDCPPLTLLAGEYRRAVLARDLPGIAAFIGEESLRCGADAFVPAEVVRRSLQDPKSFLAAALFDGPRLRSGPLGPTTTFRRESQAELLASEELVVNVTNQAATRQLPRRARVAYKVPRSPWLEIGFECRSVGWVLQDWGGLECHLADQLTGRPPAGR